MEKLILPSPIGNLTLIGEDFYIVRIDFDNKSVKTFVCDKARILLNEQVISFNEQTVLCKNMSSPGELCSDKKLYSSEKLFLSEKLYSSGKPSLCGSLYSGENLSLSENLSGCEPYMLQAAKEISAYFNGQLKDFTFPTRMKATPFSQRVYECLRQVPYGQTVTYKQLGIMAGMERGFRAIGQVMKRNPLPIVYPCHRVVASDGIGGFSGGLDIKRFLLSVEGVFV